MFIKDFFLFRRMLTPVLIQILFWLGVVVCLVSGVINMLHKQWVAGLEIFFLGPIIVRIICEIWILFFRMNDTLTDIRDLKKKK